ncbi:cytochrome c3 family protein [Luteibacter sp.]|uniref:cytochrome c3 family protein n=1 Tax=Luteibacter sp. TaxID=1886636 RepID=UPI003F7F371D
MAQAFHPRSGLYAALACLAVFVMVVAGVATWRGVIAEPNATDEAVEQPIPFSHQHHVGEVGLDCRYCHASVETAAFAGMPPLSTCMTCHSQLFAHQPVFAPLRDAWQGGAPLRWTRVHDLPDFVYFNHAVHVSNGVGCISCHGDVAHMPLMRREAPLTMKWCLDCHRHPERAVRAPDQVLAMQPADPKDDMLGMHLVEAFRIDRRRLTDCSVCHR